MTDESIEKFASIAFGWLLGLLSPVIVEAIRRRRENALGRRAIQLELKQLGENLAMACYSIEIRDGLPARPRIEWLVSQLEALSPGADSEPVLNHKGLLKFSDVQLNHHYAVKNASQGRSLTVQKYGTPLLDSRVSALWSFDSESQRTLLEIKSAMDIANEAVDRARQYQAMTFQKMDSVNYDLVVGNQQDAYVQFGVQAKRIVGLIIRFNASSARRRWF